MTPPGSSGTPSDPIDVYAIVLTHDAQLGLAELAHKLYSSLWPTNRLTFRIPVNGSAAGRALDYLERQSSCQLISTPPTIGASMRALLREVDDEAWVFWCIDDRFPVWLDAEALDAICARLDVCADLVEEVKLLRWKEKVTRETVDLGPVTFVVQRPGTRQWGFWHHHFIRAGTLRRVFAREGRRDACTIDDVLASMVHDNARALRRMGGLRPGVEGNLFRGKALTPVRPLIRLGEPLIGGLLTGNGLAELRRHDCEVPSYASCGRDKLYTWAEG